MIKKKRRNPKPSTTKVLLRILGIDLSITSTGYCIMDMKGVVKIGSIKTKPNKASFDPWDDQSRYIRVVKPLIGFIDAYKIQKIFIEAPAFGAFDMSGRQAMLRGVFMQELYEYVHGHRAKNIVGLYPVNIAPTKLKKFITGTGTAKKNLMGESIRRRFPIELQNVSFTNDDEIDAYCLAKFGQVSILVSTGKVDIKTLPKFQQQALKGFY